MADEAERGVGAPALIEALRARLWSRLLLLLAVVLVLVVLVAAGQIALTEAALLAALVVVIGIVVPDTGETTGDAAAATAATDPAFLDAVGHFADALVEPCIVLDRRSVVLHANPAVGRQFPSIVVGSPIAFTLRFPPLLSAVEAARGGAIQTVEFHQSVPTEAWYRVSIAPLRSALPAGAGLIVVTMHSLTEEKRLEQLRSDFIANASHELRTPLTSLVGFIDTLLGPASNDADARTRFLNIMRTQAGRMSKLIEDLLSLSRIEMRQHLRPSGEVELGGLVREVAEGLDKLAADSGVALKLDLPNAPLQITGDRDELYEVIENLIDNAVKYGAEGGKVDVVLGPASDRHGFDAMLSITDYGPGVAAEHVPRLTERFYRVDAESSRKKKGTGLGLAIVKHIVNRHHGLLAIKSKPGQGTRVEVLLKK